MIALANSSLRHKMESQRITAKSPIIPFGCSWLTNFRTGSDWLTKRLSHNKEDAIRQKQEVLIQLLSSEDD